MSKWTLLTTAAAVWAFSTGSAAAGDPPSREQIAAAMNLSAGSHMPVVIGGTHYEARYVRVEPRRRGEYAVVFRLRK
jgi:hypothetical protein